MNSGSRVVNREEHTKSDTEHSQLGLEPMRNEHSSRNERDNQTSGSDLCTSWSWTDSSFGRTVIQYTVCGGCHLLRGGLQSVAGGHGSHPDIEGRGELEIIPQEAAAAAAAALKRRKERRSREK